MSCRPCCPCRTPPRSLGSPPYPPDSEEIVQWFWEMFGATLPCIFLWSLELVPCSWRLPANLSGAPAGDISLIGTTEAHAGTRCVCKTKSVYIYLIYKHINVVYFDQQNPKGHVNCDVSWFTHRLAGTPSFLLNLKYCTLNESVTELWTYKQTNSPSN